MSLVCYLYKKKGGGVLCVLSSKKKKKKINKRHLKRFVTLKWPIDQQTHPGVLFRYWHYVNWSRAFLFSSSTERNKRKAIVYLFIDRAANNIEKCPPFFFFFLSTKTKSIYVKTKGFHSHPVPGSIVLLRLYPLSHPSSVYTDCLPFFSPLVS